MDIPLNCGSGMRPTKRWRELLDLRLHEAITVLGQTQAPTLMRPPNSAGGAPNWSISGPHPAGPRHWMSAGWPSAHLEGLEELKKADTKTFELSAVCDLNEDRARLFAANAEARLGKRPAVYTDYRKMIAEEKLDAVSVLLNHDLHHIVAEDCFAAGIHVQMQMPLAISPFFAREMIADAKKYDRVLTVSEPSVLGAENVAVCRAVKNGIIGSVNMLMDYATVTLNRTFFAGTAWRHFKGKAGAGWINDHGVHRTHMFTEVNGPIPEVPAHPFAHSYVELWEAIADRKAPISSSERGLEALSIVFAALESALTGHPVKVKEVMNGERHAYEDTVIEEMKLR
ncbi:Gfo/Idh/MocA family oxidoreductase [Paenibacillus sp. sptzw28]|uniref:Gfo/Idh/MocA family protein n=1 Tax=Paenibacillus sp. sptzw28 TaxID=715179 RepID=UPI001C6E87C3|nr:Gfo/Idh/MocA family oxidoreductase [Paenibacillus sp. sptzw28]QYR19225.1 Gfo/Idh/MocA family oxidoreductase [Paenibacillus sp. sptzw28]